MVRNSATASDYLAKVITGVTFKDGIEATTTDQIAA